eukprot:6472472-Amphidinium_carterae.1
MRTHTHKVQTYTNISTFLPSLILIRSRSGDAATVGFEPQDTAKEDHARTDNDNLPQTQSYTTTNASQIHKVEPAKIVWFYVRQTHGPTARHVVHVDVHVVGDGIVYFSD